MSEATEPPRWVCSSASPSPARIIRQCRASRLHAYKVAGRCKTVANRAPTRRGRARLDDRDDRIKTEPQLWPASRGRGGVRRLVSSIPPRGAPGRVPARRRDRKPRDSVGAGAGREPLPHRELLGGSRAVAPRWGGRPPASSRESPSRRVGLRRDPRRGRTSAGTLPAIGFASSRTFSTATMESPRQPRLLVWPTLEAGRRDVLFWGS